jgi:hypothetical protein
VLQTTDESDDSVWAALAAAEPVPKLELEREQKRPGVALHELPSFRKQRTLASADERAQKQQHAQVTNRIYPAAAARRWQAEAARREEAETLDPRRYRGLDPRRSPTRGSDCRRDSVDAGWRETSHSPRGPHDTRGAGAPEPRRAEPARGDGGRAVPRPPQVIDLCEDPTPAAAGARRSSLVPEARDEGRSEPGGEGRAKPEGRGEYRTVRRATVRVGFDRQSPQVGVLEVNARLTALEVRLRPRRTILIFAQY